MGLSDEALRAKAERDAKVAADEDLVMRRSQKHYAQLWNSRFKDAGVESVPEDWSLGPGGFRKRSLSDINTPMVATIDGVDFTGTYKYTAGRYETKFFVRGDEVFGLPSLGEVLAGRSSRWERIEAAASSPASSQKVGRSRRGPVRGAGRAWLDLFAGLGRRAKGGSTRSRGPG